MRQPERQHNRKGVRETSNQKYEITDIAHEKYPFRVFRKNGGF